MKNMLNAVQAMKEGNTLVSASYRVGLIDGAILGLVAGVIGTLLVLS